MEEALRGKVRTVLVFPANFSMSLQERMRDPRHTDNNTIFSSQIEVHLDDTGKINIIVVLRLP